MPSANIEKSSNLVLKQFTKMDADIIHPNNSSAQLVNPVEDVTESGSSSRTIKDVKFKEWVAVAILCFVNLINYMDRFTLAGILTDIQQYYDIKDDKGGLLQTAFILSYMIFAPLFGYLGDRYSRKLIMAAGVFLWSVTTLIGSFMGNFWFFLLFRALVGVGEASYSTIAPTIISDLFVSDVRSKMLAVFYFAIPVGSGLGYIVGSETAKQAESWQWALRVTPGMGLIAVLLILFILEDPERGQSEGSGHMETTTWSEDVKDIVKNRSFMYSTAGFTCVAFVAGALAWWGPKFIQMGIKLQDASSDADNTSYKFGVVAMLSGSLGVPLGSILAQRMRPTLPSVDAYICGFGLLISSPLVFVSCVLAQYSPGWCLTVIFFAELAMNVTWSIVADMLLYVVLPTRRSTAEGFQLLVSHALGDAGSPYLIGVLSNVFQNVLTNQNSTSDDAVVDFKALQYSLFLTCFVEVLGGVFFLITAIYVLEDKQKVEKAIQGNSLLVNESDQNNS